MHPAEIANSRRTWNGVWSDPEARDWRARALAHVYDRIVALCPVDSVAVDFGGGMGTLAARLQDERDAHAWVVDHSDAGLSIAANCGLSIANLDLEDGCAPYPDGSVVCATEVLEHLTDRTVDRIIAHAVKGGTGFFSVPNDRLGPEECPEHYRKWTAVSFLRLLRENFGDDCRVEVFGDYLLGVCGVPAVKQFRLSVCLPARDEEADIARTLASFRGVADQLVVGVDPRTNDATREIAAKYADLIFDIVDPLGKDCAHAQCKGWAPPDDGVHFAHIRNECIDRCDGDWIFMTEAHEHLSEGVDTLLHLDDHVPETGRVAFVMREGNGQQWAFPWLFENAPDIRFTRATHNILDYPAGANCVRLPMIRTHHKRHERKDVERQEQRRIQNRLTLMRDWLENDNSNSLHYLAAEWREWNVDKAIDRMREYLALPRRPGHTAYHTRLILAKSLINRGGPGDILEARAALLGCPADDWTRIEHWVWLGDIAFEADQFEQAIQFYRYASTAIGEKPFSAWWIDLSYYAWIPAQRLAMTFCALGDAKQALHWAKMVVELLPPDQDEALQEARDNQQLIEEAIRDGNESS